MSGSEPGVVAELVEVIENLVIGLDTGWDLGLHEVAVAAVKRAGSKIFD